MLFSYDEYKDRYAIIGYEIPPTEDSQLKIFPLETRAELSVNVTFNTEKGVNLKTYYIKFFCNQFNMGFARVTYLSFYY